MPLYRPPLIAPSHHLSSLLPPQKWPQYYKVTLDGDSGQGQGQGPGQGPRGGKAAARSRRRAAATAEEDEDDGAHADL